jgi:hypothetical protein
MIAVAVFEVVMVAGQKLVRVRLSETRRPAHTYTSQRWPSTIFHEVVSEREALTMALHFWDCTEPCWRQSSLVNGQHI